MKRMGLAAGAAILLVASGASKVAAQHRNPRLVAAEPGRLMIPLCQLRLSGKVNDGVKQLRTGIEDKEAPRRAAALAKAEEILVQDIRAGNDQSPAAWYYLGRAYLARGDVVGADSAFTRVVGIVPDCELDIDKYRQNAWALLANAAIGETVEPGQNAAAVRGILGEPDEEITSRTASGTYDIWRYGLETWVHFVDGKVEIVTEARDRNSPARTAMKTVPADTALALLRDASIIFGGLPHVFENMGILFANMAMNDSAAAYFERAMKVAEPDTSLVENRNSATINLALMYQRLGRHQEAIATLRRFLEWKPTDTEARRSVAMSFREMGQADSAEAIEQALVAEFATMNLDSLSASDLMAVGVSHFNNKQYAEAAKIFEKVATTNPWNRDAVYNLTNAYLALEDNEKIVATGRRLLAIEPLYEDAYRLVGQGFRGLKQQDSLVVVAEKLVRLPVNLQVTMFSLRTEEARWVASATGRAAMDASGKPLPPAPITIVVEFLNDGGNVVASEEANIPALEQGKSEELQVEAKGEGITAWRYRRK